MTKKRKVYTPTEAKYEAQKIAFAPFYFQAVVCMRDLGILEVVGRYRKGISQAAIAKEANVSLYGVKVLVEAGLVADVFVETEDGLLKLSRVGRFLRRDRMTEVNLNFAKDVCYLGLDALKDSIVNGKPEGLKVLGQWPTIYEGLSKLPEKAKKSWFEFDHFYSDEVFPHALKIIFKEDVQKLYDIGGNTGKFARACCEHDSEVEVTMLDLPGQLNVAKEENSTKDYADRIKYFEIDLLDENQTIPKGASAVWMSQFLDCFGEDEIVSILERVHEAADENTYVYILEPFWNNQEFPASELCLVGTSLYFTAMANGNSKMYRMEEMIEMANNVGFELVEKHELIAKSYHTILKLKKK